MTRFYDPLTDTVIEAEQSKFIPLDEQHGTEPNTAIVDGFQFAWDSTSLGELKTCPRKYYYTIIQGWTHKLLPPPLAFGIYFHTCMETWHKLLSEGMEKATALLRVVRLAGLLGEQIPSGDTGRTKETLCRSVVWYLETFWDDPAKTIQLASGKPAVEYSFVLPFEPINGVETYICGHIDRFVRFQGEIYPTDYKTTKYSLDSRFFSKFKPDNQMQVYLLAANILPQEGSALPEPASGIIVDGLQLGVNFTRFQRQVIPYSLEEIEDFIIDTTAWLNTAQSYATAKHWPANEKACDMYAGCHFREICNKKPAQRELALRSNFVQRTWNPLRSR